jgi:subtilisin family serine protease
MKFSTLIKINLLIFFFLTISNKANSQSISDNYREGEVMVQLKSGQTPSDFLKNNPGLQLKEVVAENWNIYLFGYNPLSKSENSLFNQLGRNSQVLAFQRNHKVELRAFPDDVQFGTMWGLHNTGQNNGLVDADIDAPEAWEITTGGLTANGDTIVVAVIDDGFQMTHQDLNFWKNIGEIPNNSIDDDGNGYIDDFQGWNAYNQNGNITSSQHGTHVSGTIGAKGNNQIGVTGVNWNVKVMAVQGSSGNEATVIRAYNYVFTQRKLYNETGGLKGAFVVATNASFGVDNGNPLNFPLWCAIYDSLGSVGILNAGATANANYNIDVTGDMPTACPSDWLVTVTNTTRNDTKATAGFGLKTIDLGAPGSQILSTVPNNNYSALSGTSMATPHVAGTIALMWAAACPDLLYQYKQNPAGTAYKMKQILLENTDPIAALNNITVTGGRLNAHKSLLGVLDFCEELSAPEVKGDTVCKETPFFLVAKPNSAGRVVYWYQNPTSSHIHIGDSLYVNGILNDETFYAANLNLSTNVLSPKIPVPVIVSLPITGMSPDTTITKWNGAAQLWVSGSGTSFTWTPGTGLSNGNIYNPIASPEVTTTYTVLVTDDFGCYEFKSVTVNVIDNTSVSEILPYENLKVYPVPSKDIIVFEFNNEIELSQNVSLQIVNMLGKTVKLDKIKGNTHVLNRGELQAGIYWFFISNSKNTESRSGKIIIID